MRWFRANRKIGGRLALFALALQLVLSFGHIHREDIYGYGYGPASAAASAPATIQSPAFPSDQPTKHGDDYCAVCAAMSLLGNSFAATPPQLPVPFVSHAAEQIDRVATIFIATPRASYQSRAPPTA
jgi:hypothetical protein